MVAKKKYNLIKWFTVAGSLICFFIVSCIFAHLKVDDIWGDMFENGITNCLQWFTLILYRILIYIPFPFFMGLFSFDKNTNYLSRVTNCFNWMFMTFLITKGIMEICAINLIFNINLFDKLSSFINLLGYIFTYTMKKPISFDETGNILNREQTNI